MKDIALENVDVVKRLAKYNLTSKYQIREKERLQSMLEEKQQIIDQLTSPAIIEDNVFLLQQQFEGLKDLFNDQEINSDYHSGLFKEFTRIIDAGTEGLKRKKKIYLMKGVQTDPIEKDAEEEEDKTKKISSAEERFNRMMGDDYT